jgi:hypothetical protein
MPTGYTRKIQLKELVERAKILSLASWDLKSAGEKMCRFDLYPHYRYGFLGAKLVMKLI